jgi:hypothetical protein
MSFTRESSQASSSTADNDTAVLEYRTDKGEGNSAIGDEEPQGSLA